MVSCPLCTSEGGTLIYQCPQFRVIEAQETLYPGFLRVIWNAHVSEFSELPAQDRQLLMDVVVCLEQFVRREFQPDKVNLASLGNVVPHLHWHVIPRFKHDAHFPAPVWATPVEGRGLCDAQLNIKAQQPQWTKALQAALGDFMAERFYG